MSNEKTHALLSASSSKRWLTCTPSARLTECYKEDSSEYAKQGTDAHELCEYKVRKLLGEDVESPVENLDYYDQEMEQCSDMYASFVGQVIEAAKERCSDPVVLVEKQVDYSEYVPQGFGTADAIVVADGTMCIIDFKYGQGVEVSSEGNPQMMLYAVGALNLFEELYDVDTIEMTIFQPRRDNISTASIGKDELLAWAENEVKPKAAMAWAGEGELIAGPHCQFCRAKATCRKRAEMWQELAKYEFTEPALLSDEEIATVLGKAKLIKDWLSDVESYALTEAVHGKKYQGFKLVEGRSTRKFTDEEAVAKAVIEAGYDPYVKKLRTITDLTKMLGKEGFEEVLGEYIHKPAGNPVLAPEDDKRPETTTAKIEFKDL